MPRPPPTSPLSPPPPLPPPPPVPPYLSRDQRPVRRAPEQHQPVDHVVAQPRVPAQPPADVAPHRGQRVAAEERSEEHTSELQSPCNLVCRLLLEKKKKKQMN